jgi:hypothetical protein
VKLEPCNGKWNQQFVYNSTDKTVRLAVDPTSCYDGMAGGGDQAFTHMWTCYDDPTIDQTSMLAAQEHQMWQYDYISDDALHLVSRLQVQQLTQFYISTDCCLPLSALGSSPPDPLERVQDVL